MTMAGVGMAMTSYSLVVLSPFHDAPFIPLFIGFVIGPVLICSSPGVVIGYGFHQWKGAVMGGLLVGSIGLLLRRIAWDIVIWSLN